MKRILLLAVLLSAPLFALTEDGHLAILADKTAMAANNYFGFGSQLQFEKLNATFGISTQYLAVYRPETGGYDVTISINREPSNSYELSNGFNVNGFTVKTNVGTWYGTSPKGLFYCKNPTNTYGNYPVYFDVSVPVTLNATNFSRALTQACLDYQAEVGTSVATPTATAQPTANMPNPASVNCVEKNGTLEIRDGAAGQAGYCHLPDGTVCEEWAYYRGECPTPIPTATAAPTAAPTVAPTIAPTATPTAAPSPVLDTNLLLVVLLVVMLGIVWWFTQKKKR